MVELVVSSMSSREFGRTAPERHFFRARLKEEKKRKKKEREKEERLVIIREQLKLYTPYLHLLMYVPLVV